MTRFCHMPKHSCQETVFLQRTVIKRFFEILVNWLHIFPVSDARINLTQTDLLPDLQRGIYEDSGPIFIQIGGLDLVLWIKMSSDTNFLTLLVSFFFNYRISAELLSEYQFLSVFERSEWVYRGRKNDRISFVGQLDRQIWPLASSRSWSRRPSTKWDLVVTSNENHQVNILFNIIKIFK